jgi:hypothetical protein
MRGLDAGDACEAATRVAATACPTHSKYVRESSLRGGGEVEGAGEGATCSAVRRTSAALSARTPSAPLPLRPPHPRELSRAPHDSSVWNNEFLAGSTSPFTPHQTHALL